MNHESDMEQLLEMASEAKRSGALAAAAQYLQRALELDSHDPMVLVRLGHVQIDREQYAAAIDAFERALVENPGFAAAHSGLGQALGAVGQLSEAAAALRDAIRLGPTSARFVLLGDVLSSLMDDLGAEASFRHALLLDPQNEEAMFNLAILIRQHAPDEAAALLDRAIKVDPLYAAARRELGYEFIRRGDLIGADDQLRSALAIEPDDPWTHIYLGNALWASGKIDDAEAEFLRAVELDPLWATSRWLAGMFYRANGKADQAERAFRGATIVEPRDAASAFQLAQYLVETGFESEAQQWLTRALDLEPQNPRALALRERIRQ